MASTRLIKSSNSNSSLNNLQGATIVPLASSMASPMPTTQLKLETPLGSPTLSSPSPVPDEQDEFYEAAEAQGAEAEDELQQFEKQAAEIHKSGFYLGEVEDEEDEEEEEEAEDASPTSATRPSKSGKKSRKMDKATIKQILESADEARLEEDMRHVEGALELFLDTRLIEAEQMLKPKYGISMYYTLGFAVIRVLKALMTFEPEDVSVALDALKKSGEIAHLIRKRKEEEKKPAATGFMSSISGMFSGAANMVSRGASNIAGISKEGSYLKEYSRLQRHAELIYGESQLLRALLTLLTDTNIVAFVKEGIHIRSSYNTIKACYKFVERVYEEEGEAAYKKYAIDDHFVSGVLLSMGTFSLALSMLPGKVLKIFEMIGFSGDRDFALNRLGVGARWPDAAIAIRSKSKLKSFKSCFPMPKLQSASGGLRKPLCDLALFGYHIVFSSMMPIPDCNLPLAKSQLDLILKDRSRSFIFLFIKARSLLTEGQLEQAEKEYEKVMEMQKDWRQLVHVCLWDLGMCRMALGKWQEASQCYKILFEESKWSKVVYRYAQAVCLYAKGQPEDVEQVKNMMSELPKYVKRIAGKSLPIEKFLCRKARKFVHQGNRLFLPHYELLYFLFGVDKMNAERYKKVTAEVDMALKALEKQDTPITTNKQGTKVPYDTYYDDVCFARFLKGLIEREKAYPNHIALHPLKEQVYQGFALQLHPVSVTVPLTASPQVLGMMEYSLRNFQSVESQSINIELDHWLLPFTLYEMGTLYMRQGRYALAREAYEKALKGWDNNIKVSMENSLTIRTHNALVKLQAMEQLAQEEGLVEE